MGLSTRFLVGLNLAKGGVPGVPFHTSVLAMIVGCAHRACAVLLHHDPSVLRGGVLEDLACIQPAGRPLNWSP